MPILVPKGNTRVGEVAGQFILRNKQMALEKAIAQQRAALEAARIRVSRENAEAARQDAAADRALRREGMEMRSKESALERQARSEESRLSRALQKDIAEGGWDVRRDEGKASREQAKALADAQISATREESKETRKFQEKMSKARTEAERKTLMDKEARRLNVSLPEDATYEEKQKILADAGRQKEWNDRQQRKQDLYTSQGGTYNPVPYGSAPFAEALADLEARKGIRKAKQEEADRQAKRMLESEVELFGTKNKARQDQENRSTLARILGQSMTNAGYSPEAIKGVIGPLLSGESEEKPTQGPKVPLAEALMMQDPKSGFSPADKLDAAERKHYRTRKDIQSEGIAPLVDPSEGWGTLAGDVTRTLAAQERLDDLSTQGLNRLEIAKALDAERVDKARRDRENQGWWSKLFFGELPEMPHYY